MDIREKLVELMIEAKKADTEDAPFSEFLADFMIDHGVTVQEWIPVSDRLPKEGDDVLVFGYWHEKWQPLICHLSPNFKGSWYTMPAGMQVYSVTHWMPLPTPPKGE